MFTNNYQIYRQRMFCGGPGSSTVTDTGGTKRDFRSGDGAYMDIGYYLARVPTSHITTSTVTASSRYNTDNCGVVFGSGTTPATREDIDMENRITSGYSVSYGGLNLGKVTDGLYCAWCSYTISNTSTKDITISEIGILTNLPNTSTNNNYAILMERTVLDEPITIAPNDQKIITYKIEFHQ